jgi:predicted ATPase/DNA-binding SARP family transcriptional activator/Tfp pilus assembly protein PilF
MSSLKLFLLGQPRFERDGQPLKLDTRKNVALVAYLALMEGRHSRETLITLLWPELEPRGARAVLRRNLSVLGKSLGGEWLVVDGDEIGTDPGADFWLDVDRFRHLLADRQAHNHSDTQVCSRRLDALAEAVELYRGDLMESTGLRDSAAFDEWQFFQTENLRQMFTAALEKLVHGHSARGEFEPAIRYARRWLALDPLHEPAHRHLMQLYARSGQHAAALRQYQECVGLLNQELSATPDQETTDLYVRIKNSPTLILRHNLPSQSTPFIVRAALLNEIKARIVTSDCRLLTLFGPGGSGKTRLAVEAARQTLADAQLGRFPDGVFFVPLAPLRSAEAVVPTIAQALDLPLHTANSRRQLLDYLRHKHLLLILDNVEHLLGSEGILDLVVDIIDKAQGVCILTTSRFRLHAQSETLIPVGGMDYPELLALARASTEHPASSAAPIAAGHSAVALFLDAARRVQPGYEPTNDDLASIIRICQQVEGMPLGILLAASWIQTMSLAEIAGQITAQASGHSLSFLETESRDVPERHRSMRAVLDHSWALLTAREREVMQGLSVFQGSFAREAAQPVAGTTLPELRALINKSLLHFQPSGRYHIHELVRQYVIEKLVQSPAVSKTIGDRHCAWYMTALQRWALDIRGSRQKDVLAEIDGEIENARAAWDWAIDHTMIPSLVLALEGLCSYYQLRGRLEEGKTACRSVIEKLQDAVGAGEVAPLAHLKALSEEKQRLLAKGLTWQGVFTRLMGYASLAEPILKRSIVLLDALESTGHDVRAARAFALLEMGWQTLDLDRARARHCFEQSLDLYQVLDDRWGMADALYALGWLIDGLGDYDGARRVLDESLAIRQAVGDRQGAANSLAQLGLVALRVGQLEQGENLLRQSIALLREMGERVGLPWRLHLLGFAAFLQGRFEQGIAIQEECLAIASDLALGHDQGMALQALGSYHAMLGQYEQARAYATTGLAHARALVDPYVIGATCLVLGLISLPQEEYADAQGWFEQSFAAYHEMGQLDAQSWSLALLGYASLGMNDLIQSRRCLYQALQMGIESDAFLPIVIALSGIALLLVRLDDVGRAVELWALLSCYPVIANALLFQNVVGRPIAAAAETLPPETVAAAKERSLLHDLSHTATEMLTQLGTP